MGTGSDLRREEKVAASQGHPGGFKDRQLGLPFSREYPVTPLTREKGKGARGNSTLGFYLLQI